MRTKDLKGNSRLTPKRVMASAWRRTREPLDFARLAIQARTASHRLVDPSSDVVVTLTTHGKRMGSVHLTIETIGRGRDRPARIILYLDAPLPAKLPVALERLIPRGLEIEEVTGNFGPHTKYYPFVTENGRDSDGILHVTADDDVIYPPTWLRDLRSAYIPNVKEVICHRAHRFQFQGESIAPYNKWDLVDDSSPSILHMATGVSGVLYPPSMQKALRDAGEAFRDKAPKADDVWLHWVALQSGHSVRQIRPQALNLSTVWGSQAVSLLSENMNMARNDYQIRNCYSGEDIQKLLRAEIGS